MNHRGKRKTQNYNEIDNGNDNDLTHKLNKMNTWEVDRRWEAKVELFKKNAMVWFVDSKMILFRRELFGKEETCEFWFGALGPNVTVH